MCSASWKACPRTQLRRPVLPSGWNCLGLVKHLALAEAQAGVVEDDRH